ncbi:hypothetical protein [Pontibacter sp. SGAir0037]|uniref:hypothetical protein n=1 Tax=Pontibacter sp. SGAir0037 TaxID=2571030 RepID=UPI0010CD0C2E|nr:hypothetical protein [Pontibacter sp. SGAir0037]QCR23897.1 hypothetical protein C1N53_17105 [Pontibacter sp. SGAir0037]
MLPHLPPYLTWFVAAIVILLLIWLAWRRPNRRHLIWRVAASIVAGASLVCLLFPPTYQKAIDPATAILLTENYNQDTLNTLVEHTNASPLLFSYKAKASRGATPVPDLYTLRQQQPGLQTIHLLGQGLETQQLEALKGLQLVPHLNTAPAGIYALHWPESVKAGEALVVAGRFKGTSTKATLYLQAAGTLQDSTAMAGDSSTTFKLRFIPKQKGLFVYNILSKEEEHPDTIGQIPVLVEEPTALRVLLLAAAPLFEFRFLKDYLAQQQHQVAIRTSVSKDISQSEWLNMPQTSLEKLTPALLQKFDIVITEPELLQKLTQAERTALQKAVSESGLGVLTIAGEQINRSSATSFFTSFGARRVGQQDTRTTRASWATLQATLTALPFAFVKDDAVSAIVEDQNGLLLAAGRKAGWGTVAVTAIPQTFQWQLESKQSTYNSYWAHVLSAVARKEVKESFWQLLPSRIPKPNQPLTLAYTNYALAGASGVPAATILSLADSSKANPSFAQDAMQPERFTTTFWPRQSGWHKAEAPEAEPYYFYVQDTTSWKFADLQAKQEAVAAFIAQQHVVSAATPLAYTKETIPLIWFFCLFVMSSGFLWLEEKL